MVTGSGRVAAGGVAVLAAWMAAHAGPATVIDVPLVLDHNRMLVDAEIQGKDGAWRTARLWIDTGNPEFMVSEECARSLGFDAASPPRAAGGALKPVPLPSLAVRLSGEPLDTAGLTPMVRPGASRLWGTMHADGNIPSTVLRRYQVAFDYPARRVQLAAPGSMPHRGAAVPARVHPETGIAQIEVAAGGERLDLAIDVGASFTFVSGGQLTALAAKNANWPRVDRALGCANIWGTWPEEERWPVLRVPEIRLGPVAVAGVGVVGLPDIFGEGVGLGAWYSRKTAAPVAGFLGPNAFKGFRLEIDYAHGMVYLERGGPDEVHDMDLVGLTLRPEGDAWRVAGSAVEGVEPGDMLIQAGDLSVTGATMGTVVDALRGAPGDLRVLVVERNGKRVRIEARVRRHL